MHAAIDLKVLKSDCAKDVDSLQSALESAPSYWLRVEAKIPRKGAARGVFEALPPGNTYEDKFVLGVFQSPGKASGQLSAESGEIIGCVDLIRGYPNSETAMLGLLIISEAHQKKGIGRLAYQKLEKLVQTWPKIRKMRIGVLAVNGIVLPFWKSLGFIETGVRHPYEENGVISENIVLEKVL